jgi:riboflavin biosynthesis pyrimidine reductase
VDELHVYMAPIISGAGVPLTEAGTWQAKSSREFIIKETELIGQDIKIIYVPR